MNKFNPFELGAKPMQLQIYYNTSEEILQNIKTLDITSEGFNEQLGIIYAASRKLSNKVKEFKEEESKSAKEEIKRINGMTNPILEQLDAVMSLANSKASEYQEFLQSKKQTAEKEIELSQMFEIAPGTQYVPDVPKNIASENATSVTTKVKSYRVTDINLVPIQFLQLNDKLIISTIKLSQSPIPGLEIYEETKTTMRIK